MSKYVNKLAQVELPSLLKVGPVIIGRRTAVLLTRKKVERIFGSEESIVVQNLHSCHPVWTVVVCNLKTKGEQEYIRQGLPDLVLLS